MATTTYEIRNGDEVIATKSKKAQAVAFAQATAKELKATLQVVTSPAGNLVVEVKARKAQIKTKPYTRLVDLPEGFKIPEGLRACYTRARKNAVILHDPEAEENAYSVYNFVTGKALAKSLPTTRACGRFLADEVPTPEKVSA